MIKRKFTKAIYISFILLAISQLMFAQAGSLDLTFGGSGYVTTGFLNRSYGHSIDLRKDGKSYVAGAISSPTTTFDIIIHKYLSNGMPDTSFGGTGYVITSLGNCSVANGIFIQNDGKLLVVGYTKNAGGYDAIVLRYKPNGSLDTSFGINGISQIDFGSDESLHSIAVSNIGEIFIGGEISDTSGTDFFVGKLNAYGWFDYSYGLGGYITTNLETYDYVGEIALQSDGKIVATGTISHDNYARQMYVARFDGFGWLDSTFGTNGIVRYKQSPASDGNDVEIQTDGKIVVAGMTFQDPNDYFAVFRFNSNGSLDTSFGTNGTAQLPIYASFSKALEIQNDGKIVAVGRGVIDGNSNFITARFLTNGLIDSTFGTSGYASFDLGGNELATDIALNPANGKILVTGYGSSQTITARYQR